MGSRDGSDLPGRKRNMKEQEQQGVRRKEKPAGRLPFPAQRKRRPPQQPKGSVPTTTCSMLTEASFSLQNQCLVGKWKARHIGDRFLEARHQDFRFSS